MSGCDTEAVLAVIRQLGLCTWDCVDMTLPDGRRFVQFETMRGGDIRRDGHMRRCQVWALFDNGYVCTFACIHAAREGHATEGREYIDAA